MTNTTAALISALDAIARRETFGSARLDAACNAIQDIQDSFADEENYYDFLLNYSNFELVAWLNKEIIDALNQ